MIWIYIYIFMTVCTGIANYKGLEGKESIRLVIFIAIFTALSWPVYWTAGIMFYLNKKL